VLFEYTDVSYEDRNLLTRLQDWLGTVIPEKETQKQRREGRDLDYSGSLAAWKR
jgi:hypothetical protein